LSPSNSVNSFPNNVRKAFLLFIQGSQHINRERIEHDKWVQIMYILDYPETKPASQTESRLKPRANAEFKIIDNKLYRKPDNRYLAPRGVAPVYKVFNLIANEHLKLIHTGQVKV
jgi:hypothetical protein